MNLYVPPELFVTIWILGKLSVFQTWLIFHSVGFGNRGQLIITKVTHAFFSQFFLNFWPFCLSDGSLNIQNSNTLNDVIYFWLTIYLDIFFSIFLHSYKGCGLSLDVVPNRWAKPPSPKAKRRRRGGIVCENLIFREMGGITTYTSPITLLKIADN